MERAHQSVLLMCLALAACSPNETQPSAEPAAKPEPLVLIDGETLGAVNTYGPEYRFPAGRDIDEITAAVRATAQAIGDRIGQL